MPADGGLVMPSHRGRTKAKVCDYERRRFAKNIFSNSSIGVAYGNLKILYDNLSLSLSLSLSLDFLQHLGTCRRGDDVSGGVVELGEFVMKEGRGGVVGVCHAPNPIPGFVTIWVGVLQG